MKPKSAVRGLVQIGSGAFPKIAGALPALDRFLMGTLVDSSRDAREPIVITHLGLLGAEMRSARAHGTLEPGDPVVVEIEHGDAIVAVDGFARTVEPARVVVVFLDLAPELTAALEVVLAHVPPRA